MFQYIKRNILRGCASQNNDFGFLADQLVGEVRVRGGRVGTVGDGNFVVHCPSPIIPISLYQIFFCEKDNVAPHNYPSHHITTDPRILHPTPEQWAGVSGGSGEAVK